MKCWLNRRFTITDGCVAGWLSTSSQQPPSRPSGARCRSTASRASGSIRSSEPITAAKPVLTSATCAAISSASAGSRPAGDGISYGARNALMTRRAASSTASDSWSASSRRYSSCGGSVRITPASSRALALKWNLRRGSAAIVSGGSNASAGAEVMANPFADYALPASPEQRADPRSGYARGQQDMTACADVPERRPVHQIDQRVGGEAMADPRDVAGVELFRAEPSLPLLHHDQRREQVRVHQRGDVAELEPVLGQEPVVDRAGEI